LFKKETDMKQFIGRKVVCESGAVGVIDSSFGQSGKFKVLFSKLNGGGGVRARVNERLVLQFKRYLNDPKKEMVQVRRECDKSSGRDPSHPSPVLFLLLCLSLVFGLFMAPHFACASNLFRMRSACSSSPHPIASTRCSDNSR
jgi:hypothetical protein